MWFKIKITFLSIIDPTASRDQAVAHPDPGRTCTAACSQHTEDEECERCVRDSTTDHVLILHSLSSYSVASREDCYQ